MVPDREIGYKKQIMSMRSALAGAASTTALLAALGNPAAVDAARDADNQALATTLTGFADWDVADLPGEVVGGVVLRLALALVLVALLCALAGRSRSRGAAFIGGWGALVVATGAAGAAGYVYQVAVVLDGRTLSSTYLDGLVQAVNSGASFGLWTGWLVGLVTALATRQAAAMTPAHVAAPRVPSPSPEPHITEPPPPWWAPTQAGNGDATVRPGPTVFPPGGMPRPVPGTGPVTPAPQPAATASQPAPARPPAPTTGPGGPGASHEMTTVSGDPHPSDPDATQPVGIPPADDDATRAVARSAPSDDDDSADDSADDQDATTTMTPEGSDTTKQMPRPPE